ncbi:hypothetical protein STENM223S_07389 [Streptomyces tendae]
MKIGTGVEAKDYPEIGSVGDITGDNIADLWARHTDNTMRAWPGKVPGGDGIAFAVPYQIDGVTGGIRIPAGTTLIAGKSYSSRSVKLAMQDDGNLVITSNAGKVLWQTGTAGNVRATARMQSDGNLTVTKADGATILWSSKTSAPGGYALLQDRGNLLINNAKGQSLWSSGTAIRHDYNEDGRSDMASWYDYSDGHDEIHTFAPNSDGSFQAPVHAWTTKSGNYTASRMKRTTGDFNGDGIGDIAALYGYPDGRVALITWTGTGDEQKPFNDPVHSWKTAAGNWTFDNVRIQSGDFNGDGRDDIAAWYAYSSGADQLYTFTANIKGGFNSPFKSFYAAQGWWAKNMKFATGDYNGDGRDDLGVFYGYEEGGVELLTFTTQPTGAFKAPIHGWESSTWGSFDRTTLHSGDFNGDGRDDIATWYDYADGQDAIISFNPSGTDGKFGNRQEVWRASTDNFTRSNMKIVTGDYNGDGRDDFGAIYGYSTGGVRTLTWTAKADGKLNNHIGGWEIKDNSWTFDRMHAIERYSPA